MIKHSPCENYLKFLVSHPDGFTNETIREVLEDRGLDYLRDSYVDKLRAVTVPPEPFYPKDPKHKVSLRFLQYERIERLYRPDAAMNVAWDVLGRPRIKETMEALLIAGAPDSAIALDLHRQFQIDATTMAVDRYRHFFWNLSLLDSTDLRVLLQMRDEADLMQNDLAPRFEANIRKKAGWHDARRVAASLPHSPISAIVTRMKTGHMPSRLDIVKVLKAAASLGAVRSYEAAAQGNLMDSKRMSEFTLATKTINDMLDSMAMPTQDLRKQLGLIVLRGTGRHIETIDMISEGRHTVDLLPASSEGADDALDSSDEDDGADEDDDVGGDSVGDREGPLEGSD